MDNQSTPTTRPNPDPTSLTTEQLHREVGWVKQMIEDHVISERAHLTERKALFLDLLQSGDKIINERIDGVVRELQLIFSSSKEAIAKSENGYEKRFASVNEFREQLSDQAARFITSAESRALHKGHEDKLAALTDRLNKRDGRDEGQNTNRTDLRANATAVIAVLAGLASFFLFLTNLDHKVDRNTEKVNQSQSAK